MASERSSMGAAAHCTGHPRSSHPRAQEYCSCQLSGLALCCGAAGLGTEQKQSAATSSYSSSSNTLTCTVGNSFLLWYLSREVGAEKELSDILGKKTWKLLLRNSQQAAKSYPTCTSQMICGWGTNAPEWRITIKYAHEYSSKLRIDTDYIFPAGNAAY